MLPDNDRDLLIFRTVFGATFVPAAAGIYLISRAVERESVARGLAGIGLVLTALLGFALYWRIAWGGRD
jgi:drug/metabolite transporter (DMT)-like permease